MSRHKHGGRSQTISRAPQAGHDFSAAAQEETAGGELPPQPERTAGRPPAPPELARQEPAGAAPLPGTPEAAPAAAAGEATAPAAPPEAPPHWLKLPFPLALDVDYRRSDYQSRRQFHLSVQLTAEQDQALYRFQMGLDRIHARLKNGKHVGTRAHAVYWLLERLNEQIEQLLAAPAAAGGPAGELP